MPGLTVGGADLLGRSPLGIVGGMGALASADFVRTVYEATVTSVEQDAPSIRLWSDPDVVDRSAAIASGELAELTSAVRRAVEGLTVAGAECVVLACMTAHAVLDHLPEQLRSRVVSLVDILMDELAQDDRPRILVRTNGSASARVFERHPAWPRVSHLVVRLANDDQRRVHEVIYRLKRNSGVDDAMKLVAELVQRYDVDGFIAGCTEFHTVARALATDVLGMGISIIDPLFAVAERIKASTR